MTYSIQDQQNVKDVEGTPSGNRTRVSPVAGEYSTTRPTVLEAIMPLQFVIFNGTKPGYIQTFQVRAQASMGEATKVP